MWTMGSSYLLLVGLQTCPATLEVSVEQSQKVTSKSIKLHYYLAHVQKVSTSNSTDTY